MLWCLVTFPSPIAAGRGVSYCFGSFCVRFWRSGQVVKASFLAVDIRLDFVGACGFWLWSLVLWSLLPIFPAGIQF